jgi:arylsulfatase A-like enzyme
MEAEKEDCNPQLSRRDVLKFGAASLGSAAVTSPGRGAARRQGSATDSRPNFVVFMTDGQRPDEMSIAGNKIIRTPYMDRVVREGIRFQNAFVVNALCAPGRASTLTGMYSQKHGVIDNKERPIAAGIPIVSDLLREAGYEVAFCGKSHVKGSLRDHYWNYYFGYVGQADYFVNKIAEGSDGQIDLDANGREGVYKGYVDDVVTSAAVEWLQGRRQKPFCLFLWLYAPHDPYLRPRHYLDLFRDIVVPKPATFDHDLNGYPGKPKAFIEADNKIGTFEWAATLESLVKNHYASTMAADDDLGRVLEVLSRTGKLDQTVVILTADHGYFLGEWRLVDKRLMHEPSIRIPLVIRYPKMIKPGLLNRRMVLNIDLAPTMLELAGLQAPEHMQGRSLVSVIDSKDSDWRKDWLYEYYEYPGWHMVPKNRGVRTERYKLIEYYEQEPTEYELYDLETDPGEEHNLYGDQKHADLTHELLARLEELRKETGET